jgi:glyceraldehyde 3-phosphate dehydrogenase
MLTRIGINGFGRMGRLALRAGWGSSQLEFVHVNEVAGGPTVAAHLLEFDSVHGRWNKEIRPSDRAIAIDGREVAFSTAPAPGEAKWSDHGVDVVLECTGKFKTVDKLEQYRKAGVKKVIVAAPVKEREALNIVVGVNDHLYDPAEHWLLTAASCTTNCLAPVVKVVHEHIGIRHGVITTVHDMTNTQVIVDAPHKDLRRARASALSLIPTSTGSATAIGLIYPELLGKLTGIAVRVPLLNASLTDCVFEVQRATTVEEVNAAFKRAAEQAPLKGILGFEERELVSVDFKDDPRSAIVDGPLTMVVDETCVKVLAWYDNEIGYVNRMVELAAKVGESLRSAA